MNLRAVLPALLLLLLACEAEDPIPRIHVEAITPTAAYRGEPVVIRGTNLGRLATLHVGGVRVDAWRHGAGQISFRIPGMAESGLLRVSLTQDEVDDVQQVSFEVRDRDDAPWQVVDVGHRRTCAVTTDERLFCWGDRAPGDGWPGGSDAPVEVTASTRWSTPASVRVVGRETTCASDADANLWCWSDAQSRPEQIPGQWDLWTLSFFGVCGDAGDGVGCYPWDDESFDALEPAMGPSMEWQEMRFGGGDVLFNLNFRFCGITVEQELWCSDGPELAQVGAGRAWTHLALGPGADDFRCALSDGGGLWCWGTGPATPDGRVETVYPLMELYPWGGWTALDAGPRAACGIRQGQLYCWGWNSNGVRTADALDYATVYPERIGEQSDWRSVSVGSRSACAIREDGTLWCWGASPLPGSDAREHPRPHQVVLR